jgi:hypothetical protein
MEVTLHQYQSSTYEDIFIKQIVLYAVINCCRGWGKSYMAAVCAVTAIYELLELDKRVPNKVVYIIAPTYDQVKDIYFPILAYDLGMEALAKDSSRDRGRFVFDKGVELRLVSYDAIERLRGKGAYLIIWDEVSSCKTGVKPKEAWESIIQPCLVTRWSTFRAKQFGAKSPGRAILISTPKGFNFFAEALTYELQDPEWKSYTFDYTCAPFLDPVLIEKLRHKLDLLVFASEYLALVKESGANVFYPFDRNKHVRTDIEPFTLPIYNEEGLLHKGEDVHVCIDFNVIVMASSMFSLRGKQQQFINEIKGHANTEELAKYLSSLYKDHTIYAYPDPTGKARKASAAIGVTDLTILKDYGLIVLARHKSPPIIDSVHAVNRRLMTAAGEINMYFSHRVTHTIMSMERTKWADNNIETATIDKTEGLEHFSDGVRYATEYLFPIRSGSIGYAKSHSF